MKKEEFLQQIAGHFPEELTEDQAEVLESQLAKAVKEAPQCNKCGNFFKGTRASWGSISVNVTWGYQSTGKDTDQDKWKLCQACSNAFRENCEPLCCICTRPVVEIMAELYSRNPHCIFYGDYKGALEFYRTDRHCGLEYAAIAGRIICEICYEEAISDFKIPIKAGSYMCFSGDFVEGEGEQQKNRIEKALAYKLSGDAVSVFSETWLEFDEVVAIRNLDDAANRAIKLTYRESKPDMLAIHRKRDPDYEDRASVWTGRNGYARIPLSYLEEKAKEENKQLDMKKPAITDQGRFIAFGELVLDAADIISQFSDSAEK